MSQEKPVPPEDADELSESETNEVTGGLNPQPLPPFQLPKY
jgi:hypothetical protein